MLGHVENTSGMGSARLSVGEGDTIFVSPSQFYSFIMLIFGWIVFCVAVIITYCLYVSPAGSGQWTEYQCVYTV